MDRKGQLLGVTAREILHLPGNVAFPRDRVDLSFVFTVAFFPLPAVPREAVESSTTHGMMDHQRDVGHYCCTSLKLPVSTAATEIVLQYIFLPLHQMIN